MAAGDAAAAAGLSVVPATKDIRLGYQDINTRGDELAAHMTTGTHPFTKITGTATVAQGGTGATTAAAARTNLGAAATAHTHAAADIASGTLAIGRIPTGTTAGTVATGDHTHAAYLVKTQTEYANDFAYRDSQISALQSSKRDTTDGNFNTVTIYNSTALTNPVTSGYYAAYLNGDGRLGRTPSARKYKNAIKPATIDVAAVLALEPVSYHLIADTEHPDSREVGLIADDSTGVEHLVLVNDAGEPESVAYERVLPVALLAVVKAQQDTITALSDRLRTIEQALGIEGVA